MKAILVIGGLGVALVILTPVLRALRLRSNSRPGNQEYFAAARKRAISYRVARSARSEYEPKAGGDD